MPRHVSTFAVRRDWPDGGHDYHCLVSVPATAQKAMADDQRQRRRADRPTGWRVVQISEHDFELHRDRPHCHAPDCP